MFGNQQRFKTINIVTITFGKYTELVNDVISCLAFNTLVKVVVNRTVVILSNVVLDPSKELSTGLTYIGDVFAIRKSFSAYSTKEAP